MTHISEDPITVFISIPCALSRTHHAMVSISEVRSHLSTLSDLGPNLIGVFGKASLKSNEL